MGRYHEKFEWGEAEMHFEKSTSYTFYPHRNLKIWEDIYSYNENMDIIYIIRDPLERFRSAYAHTYERGYYDGNIIEAVVDLPLLMDASRYASQIYPFIRRFGRDQVLLLFLEDLRERPSSVIQKLAGFLEVNPGGFDENGTEVQANQSEDGGRLHHKYDDPGLLLRGVRRLLPSMYERITDNSHRALEEKPSLPKEYERAIRYMLRSEIDEIEALTGRDLDHWRHSDSELVGGGDS